MLKKLSTRSHFRSGTSVHIHGTNINSSAKMDLCASATCFFFSNKTLWPLSEILITFVNVERKPNETNVNCIIARLPPRFFFHSIVRYISIFLLMRMKNEIQKKNSSSDIKYQKRVSWYWFRCCFISCKQATFGSKIIPFANNYFEREKNAVKWPSLTCSPFVGTKNPAPNRISMEMVSKSVRKPIM